MRHTPPALVIAASLLAFAFPARSDSVLLFDDFTGDAAAGSPSAGVSFTASTAVFPSNGDAITYDPGFFPSSGSMEVRLRIDAIGAGNPSAPGGTSPWSAILDSRGAASRRAGDLMVFVETDGLVRFTYNSGVENPIANPVNQIISSTSILDGAFHTIGIHYGSSGLALAIDGVVEDADPFAQTADPRRFSLGNYDPPPSPYHFGFEGEVDWVRFTEVATVPEPSSLLLLAGGIGVALHERRRQPVAG